MSYDDTGMYALQFFPILCEDENRVTIVVDDAIACEGKNAEDDGYNHTPIHCYCLDENMVWAQIMEKAWRSGSKPELFSWFHMTSMRQVCEQALEQWKGEGECFLMRLTENYRSKAAVGKIVVSRRNARQF